MFGRFRIRTDLALEARESFEEDDVKIRGVRIEEEDDEELEIHTTRVVIETENGAKTMGKPVGTYITMEAPNMSAPDEDYHREISQKLAEHLKSLMGEGQHLHHQAYDPGIRGSFAWGRTAKSGQRHRSGSDGSDRHGDAGDHQRRGKGNASRPDHCSGCSGSPQYTQAESYDPDHRYRNQSGFRCRKSQKWFK